MAAPLRKTPLYEQAYQAIRAMILSGELRSGQSLVEVQVAQSLGVSRTPVREAFKSLISEGLLTISANGGVTVFAPSLEDIAEVYLMRAVLEAFAARSMALALDPDLRDRLQATASHCLQAVSAGDLEAAVEGNQAFHALLTQGSLNQRLRHILEGLGPVIQRYSRISLRFIEHAERSFTEHLAITEALASGTPDEVEAVTRHHILRAGARTIQTLEVIEGALLDPSSPTAKVIAPYREPLVFGSRGPLSDTAKLMDEAT